MIISFANDDVLAKKWIDVARDDINIFHHRNYAVNDDEFVCQQFLAPPFQLINTVIVF